MASQGSLVHIFVVGHLLVGSPNRQTKGVRAQSKSSEAYRSISRRHFATTAFKCESVDGVDVGKQLRARASKWPRYSQVFVLWTLPCTYRLFSRRCRAQRVIKHHMLSGQLYEPSGSASSVSVSETCWESGYFAFVAFLKLVPCFDVRISC